MRLIKSFFKWVFITFGVIVAIIVGLVVFVGGTAPDNTMVNITTDPPGLTVDYTVGEEIRTVVTPADSVLVRSGSEVTYVIHQNVELGIKESVGTFTAPEENYETVSIWAERMSEEELSQVREAQELAETRESLIENQYRVQVACKDLVRDRLRAPSTAEFGNEGNGRTQYIVDVENSKAYYSSTVDAQNGFGAMLRSTFVCEYNMDENTVGIIRFE